jgi:hypothetical protein
MSEGLVEDGNGNMAVDFSGVPAVSTNVQPMGKEKANLPTNAI